ncbi:MAG: YfiR family protein [Steroidobacteraceae bacterium]
MQPAKNSVLTRLRQAWRASIVLTSMMPTLLGGAFSSLAYQGTAWSASTTPEYQLKAVFIFSFLQFVEWPPQSFTAADSPLVIGILGNDPFGQVLDETVRGEVVNGRSLVVKRYKSVADIKDCHLLYISRSEAAQMSQLLGSLKNKNILTVSDVETFNRDGGIIRFATMDNKIRLHINNQAAKGAELVISSKLLKLADVT